jgi:hypothetical protein
MQMRDEYQGQSTLYMKSFVVRDWKRRTEINISLYLPVFLLSCVPLFVMLCFFFNLSVIRYLCLYERLSPVCRHVRMGVPPTMPCSTARWLPPVTLADRTQRALHSKIYLRPFALFVIQPLQSAARYLRGNREYHWTDNIPIECHSYIAKLWDFLSAVKVKSDLLHGGNKQIPSSKPTTHFELLF